MHSVSEVELNIRIETYSIPMDLNEKDKINHKSGLNSSSSGICKAQDVVT